MKQLFILLSILLISLTSSIAQSEIDSLEALLKKDIQDTLKINLLIKLENRYRHLNTDKSIEYSEKLLALSQKLNDFKHVTLAYKSIGINYMRKNYSLDTILVPFQKAIAVAEKHNYLKYKYGVISSLAMIYRKFGQRDTAFALLTEVLTVAEKYEWKDMLSGTLINSAVMLKYQSNPKKAKAYYIKGLKIAREINNQRVVAIASNNLAAIYAEDNQLDSALIYYHQSLEIKKEMHNQYGMVMSLSNIGGIYTEKEEYEKASEYLKQGYELAKEVNDAYGLAVCLSYLAILNQNLKKYTISNNYLEEEIEILKDNDDIYLKMDCHMILGQNHQKLGNYKKALDYFLSFRELNDSIYSLEKNRQIQELETKYDVSKKEAQNKLLQARAEIAQKQNRNRTFVIVTLGVILLLVVGWSYYIYRANQEKKKINEILEIKVKERTRELEQANYELRTFSYIASHDIKEPIRNVGNYAGLIFRKLPDDLKSSLGSYFDTIKRSTSQLYTLIEDFARYTTLSRNEGIEKQTVDLNELADSLETVLETTIQKYNGKVINNGLPTIASSTSLLYTTFKNLIENGLKYNQSATPTVELSYNETATHHEIIVSDNGIGIEEVYHEKIFEMFKRLHNRGEYEGSGIGLAIVKLSIDKLNGDLKLESEEGKGSVFTLRLPKE